MTEGSQGSRGDFLSSWLPLSELLTSGLPLLASVRTALLDGHCSLARSCVSLRLLFLTHLATAIALALCLCTGCSKPAKSAADLDASELLALLQDRQKADA